MDAIEIITDEPNRLTADQEIALAKAIEAGLYARHCLAGGLWAAGATTAELELIAEQGERALLVFWRANTAMVRRIARKWDKPGVAELEELVAEGGAALVEAIHRWDWRRGARFSTLAWLIVSQRVGSIGAQQHSAGMGGRSLVRRLAAAPGGEAVRLSSLWTSRPDTGENLAADRRDEQGAGVDWLDALPGDERRVLVMAFGLDGREPRTLAQMSRSMGVSVASVARTKRRALERGRRLAVQALAA
ncbi:sigma factor-like helix-turn-helix DNA-binding protein [uncultured Propionibacterium sp.]|uniref:sigma factor-like helix-turn-helix DNA-binding protein n=1 Tax=uncultured Propionibacterium sp. TaxID=218066 RepID=UPI002930E4FE|nr:sigma factor-like helix-turn-helix DNA-binding protein [uncultured Propionibacterium sp.]